ncbi:hypothetical protein [Paraburkholderia acidiphila]|nr:hypothetical protein [Paraburkholderia acidiphila]
MTTARLEELIREGQPAAPAVWGYLYGIWESRGYQQLAKGGRQ